MENGLRRPSFLRVIVALAATVVVGIHLSAPILNPILFAVVLALLFSPSIRGSSATGSLLRSPS